MSFMSDMKKPIHLMESTLMRRVLAIGWGVIFIPFCVLISMLLSSVMTAKHHYHNYFLPMWCGPKKQ